MIDKDQPATSRAPASAPVVQQPVSQPAPARVTRPMHVRGPRPDLPDFVTRALRR